MKGPKLKDHADEFLSKRLTNYDKWLKKGTISYSSKVIPVQHSLEAERRILPSEQATRILRDARTIAVQPCECRTHYQRCDNPLEVCLLFDEVADKLAGKGRARYVSLQEAEIILEKADKSGLVHLTLYMPDHKLYALCSCCSCCCHDLQIIRKYDRKDLMMKSAYTAFTDDELCVHCGACMEKCVFDARKMVNDQLVFDGDKCMGCGLCIGDCPTEAITMMEAGVSLCW